MSFSLTRALRWIVLGGLLIVLGLTASAYFGRRARAVPAPPRPAVMAADINQQTQAFSLSKTLANQTVYTVRAEQVTNYKDKALLHGVTILIYGNNASRHDRITAAECEYDPAASTVFVPGEVQMSFDIPLQPAPRQDAPNPESGIPNPQQDAAPQDRKTQSALVSVTTSALHFDQNSGVATTDADVRFQFAQGYGTAHGVRYDPHGESMDLNSAVDFTITNPHVDETASPTAEAASRAAVIPTRVEAGLLHYTRAGGKMHLERSVRITQGTRQVTADTADVLLDQNNHAQQASLQGHLSTRDDAPGYLAEATAEQGHIAFSATGRISGLNLDDSVNWNIDSLVAGQPGQMRQGRAQHVEMSFDESTGLLRTIHAAQQVEIILRSAPRPQDASTPAARSVTAKPATASQTIRAEEADLDLMPDGKTLQSARMDRSATLVLEPDTSAGAGGDRRTVQASHFDLGFTSQGALSDFGANGAVQTLAEDTGPSHRQRKTSSDFLQAEFTPETGVLRHARQWGHFTYAEADRQARAQQGEYTAGEETLVLTGDPVASSSQTKITADRIQMGTQNGLLTAEGNVLSTFYPTPSANNPQPEPVHVAADHLRYSRSDDRADYDGKARLWQGDALTIEAASIELRQSSGELRAEKNVYSVFNNVGTAQAGTAQPSGAVPAKAAAARPAKPGSAAIDSSGQQPNWYRIRADSLVYRQHESQAHYNGSVHLESPSGTVSSGELDLFFDPAGDGQAAAFSTQAGALQRITAQEKVNITDGQRIGTGDRAEYVIAQQQVQLFGGPAVVTDPAKGVTRGIQLTYFLQGDSIQVEGQPGSRTDTRWKVHP